MAQIAYFTASRQAGMKLKQEQFLRPMGWGNEWQQLRIGVRMAYEAPNGGQQQTSLFIGVCSNMLQWNDANCAIAGYWFSSIGLGTAYPGLTTANWNGFYYSGSSNGYRATTKVGATYNFGAAPSEGTFYPIMPLTQMMGVYIDRTSGTFTIGGGYNNNSFNAYSADEYYFLASLDDQSMPGTFLVRGAGTVAMPSSAPLNTLIIVNFSSVPYIIFNVGVQRTL